MNCYSRKTREVGPGANGAVTPRPVGYDRRTIAPKAACNAHNIDHFGDAGKRILKSILLTGMTKVDRSEGQRRVRYCSQGHGDMARSWRRTHHWSLTNQLCPFIQSKLHKPRSSTLTDPAGAHTILIDRARRIAAITYAEKVTPAVLGDLLDGKPVSLPLKTLGGSSDAGSAQIGVGDELFQAKIKPTTRGTALRRYVPRAG